MEYVILYYICRAKAKTFHLYTLMKNIIIHLGETVLEIDMMTKKLKNDWKYPYKSFDISRNSVSFSEDKVRTKILHNESILNKNVKVIFEEEAGTFMTLYTKSMIICY